MRQKHLLCILLSGLSMSLTACWDSNLYDTFVTDGVKNSCGMCIDEQGMAIPAGSRDACLNAGKQWLMLVKLVDPKAAPAAKAAPDGGKTVRYARQLADDSIVCGAFHDVIQEKSDAQGCAPEALAALRKANQYASCPAHVSACVDSTPEAFYLNAKITEIQNPFPFICTEQKCVDANAKFNASLGECQVAKCAEGSMQCGVDPLTNAPHCYKPDDASTCGMRCEEGKLVGGVRCPTGVECVNKSTDPDSPQFQCLCDTNDAIVYAAPADRNRLCPLDDAQNYWRCLDPSRSNSCGESACTGGVICSNETSCLWNETEQAYQCACAQGKAQIKGIGICIDPQTDKIYCGSTPEEIDAGTPKAPCRSDQTCEQGACVCLDGLVDCDGHCINSMTNPIHCGAKGQCNIPEADSPDYQGEICAPGFECIAGQCTCVDDGTNYILCKDKTSTQRCRATFDNASCGITRDDTTLLCNFAQCDMTLSTCGFNAETKAYQCQCIGSNGVMCDGGCINPKSNLKHCGAKGLCNSPVPEDANYQGATCEGDTFCKDGVCSDFCPLSEGFVICGNNKVCVRADEYHVNDGCTACQEGYCYHGDRNPDGSVAGGFNFAKCEDASLYCGGCTKSDGTPGVKCASGQECVSDLCVCKAPTVDCTQPDKTVACVNPHTPNFHMALDKCACEDRYENVDQDWTNGCEIHLDSDPNHCGEPKHQCADFLLHVQADTIQCRQGVCDYTDCLPGFEDLDGDRTNGCESQKQNYPPESCGEDKKNCYNVFKNYKPDEIRCTDDGTCTHGDCEDGYEDADNDGTCEKISANLCGDKSPTDCNAQFQNATGVCNNNNKKCDFDKCLPGYGDCDRNQKNGCETPIDTYYNCGQCGAQCEDDNICYKEDNQYKCCHQESTKIYWGKEVQCCGTKRWRGNWYGNAIYRCSAYKPTREENHEGKLDYDCQWEEF